MPRAQQSLIMDKKTLTFVRSYVFCFSYLNTSLEVNKNIIISCAQMCAKCVTLDITQHTRRSLFPNILSSVLGEYELKQYSRRIMMELKLNYYSQLWGDAEKEKSPKSVLCVARTESPLEIITGRTEVSLTADARSVWCLNMLQVLWMWLLNHKQSADASSQYPSLVVRHGRCKANVFFPVYFCLNFGVSSEDHPQANM